MVVYDYNLKLEKRENLGDWGVFLPRGTSNVTSPGQNNTTFCRQTRFLGSIYLHSPLPWPDPQRLCLALPREESTKLIPSRAGPDNHGCLLLGRVDACEDDRGGLQTDHRPHDSGSVFQQSTLKTEEDEGRGHERCGIRGGLGSQQTEIQRPLALLADCLSSVC